MLNPDREPRQSLPIRRHRSAAGMVLLSAWVLASPPLAQSIDVTAPSCGGEQNCSDIIMLFDGVPCGNLKLGECVTQGADDCQAHMLSLCTGNCICPGTNPADDFSPSGSSSDDPAEGDGAGLPSSQGVTLGDECGASPRKCLDIPLPPSHPCDTCPVPDPTSRTPVHYASGQMSTVPQVDFVVEDPFFPVRFERTYSSSHRTDSALGWGWRHNYQMQLHEDPTNGVFRLSGRGKNFSSTFYNRLIDNDNGSGAYENAATFTGTWTASTSPTNYIGVNYVHDGNTPSVPKTAQFRSYLAYSGRYEVFIHYTSDANRCSNCPVDVHHADGVTPKTVNMRTGGGVGQSLGIYNFREGNSGYVEIRNTETNGYVIADAVRFEYRDRRSTDGSAILKDGAVSGEYDLIENDGTVYHFDDDTPHRLTSITNVDGHSLGFGYTGAGLLDTITTPAGRVITFSYVLSGGKERISSISTGGQVLAQYAYTTLAGEGADGRLKSVAYPEDGSGYLYSYSSFDSLRRLLERVEDFSGNVVEEHTWGAHPYTGGFVVLSSTAGSEKLDFNYSTRFIGGPGSPGQRKTTVTRHIDATPTTDTFDVEFDFRGRVTKKTGGCSSCGQSAIPDSLGNPAVYTDGAGRSYRAEFDRLGNKVSETQVTVQTNQTLAGTFEFNGPMLDATRWMAVTNGAQALVEQNDGLLNLAVAQGAYNRKARVSSRFRLQGNFDVSFRYSGVGRSNDSNAITLGVSASPEERYEDGYVIVQQVSDNGWRWARREPNTFHVYFSGYAGTAGFKRRRGVMRMVRSGNTFTTYFDGTNLVGSVAQTMPSELYLFVQTTNFDSTGANYEPQYFDAEDIIVNSGTVLGDTYTPVAATSRTWEYKNPLLPAAMTRAVESSVFTGLQKTTTYDYDDPGADPQPSVPNSHPTKKLFRVIEEGYTDENHDATPELISRVTAYTYYGSSDPNGKVGQLKTVDGPLANDTVTYAYDSAGQLFTVTNPLGQVARYDSYDIYGSPEEIFDVNNVKTALSYSRRGQVLTQTFDPSGLNLIAANTYLDDLLQHSVSPKGMVTLHAYDGYRRLESTARRATLGGADLEKALYSYNYEGLRVLEEIRDNLDTVKFSSTSKQGKSVDPADGVTLREYVKIETPTLSNHWTTTWSDAGGRPVTRQDPSGHLTRYEYNALGQLFKVTEKSVSDGQGAFPDHETTYLYDDAGDLKSVTDPMGLITTYTYDDFGRLLEVVSPDSGTTRYGYDLAGRMTSRTQGFGSADVATSAYAYDTLGRLLGVAYQNPGRDVDYYYDGEDLGGNTTVQCNGQLLPIPQPNSEGRLSAVALRLDSPANEKIVTTYEYDKRGLVLFERKYVLCASSPHVTAYTYDADGNVELITYPRGLVVDYVYAGADQDRVSSVQANRGGGFFDVATAITYYPFGDVKSLSYGNGRSLALGLDQAYRLGSLDVPSVLYRGFGRDSRGNITSVGYTISTTDKTFTYDEVSRLRTGTGPFGSYSYLFDKSGNRLEVNEGSTTTYQYYAGTNRISGFNESGSSLSYSGLGNLIQNGTNLLGYGPDDRLKQFGPSGAPVAKFLHLADGRRLEKLPTAGDPVVYHHDQAGNVITETHVTDPVVNTENPSAEYVYLGAHRLAVITSQGPSGGYLPTIAQGPGSADGSWYAKLVNPDALKSALWMVLGLSGVSMSVALYRRRPRLAGAAGLALVAGGGAVLWIGATPNAEAIPVPSNAYFFHNGHLGEPLALTNNAGSVVWLTDYKPYGELYGESGSVTIGNPGTTGIVWKPNFRFPGQIADQETGLVYNHWRYYMPGLGNYTRPDPAAWLERGNHRYSYAKASPLGFTDAEGLTPRGPGGRWCDEIFRKKKPCASECDKEGPLAIRNRRDEVRGYVDSLSRPSTAGLYFSERRPIAAGLDNENPSDPAKPWVAFFVRNPCIAYCMCIHEGVHEDQYWEGLSVGVSSRKPFARGEDCVHKPGFEVENEYHAYSAELGCLEGYLK